ncbi:MAG: antibiotic biosynthesis monooxygenase family protein [Pseudomonadota bacterium]
MIEIQEMGKAITFFEQMELKGGPVQVINKIAVEPEEADELIRAWTVDFEIMRQQPGYISMQLYGGIGNSGVYLNHSVWESVEDLKRAFERPEFQATLLNYPPSAVANPHIFEKRAVPGCCVA